LGAAGLTRQKQRYLRELAGAVRSGRLDLEGLAARSDEDAGRILREIPGIGRWTSDVYLLSALRRPDIWPVGDRALQVGTGEVLGLDGPPSHQHLGDIGQRWIPYRSVAARLVWHSYLTRRNRTETQVRGLAQSPPEG
ncbi:MAG: DNA-3-methyladenine glycosylase family protein, partial [Actinomycetota bacterium]